MRLLPYTGDWRMVCSAEADYCQTPRNDLQMQPQFRDQDLHVINVLIDDLTE
jgi:hypothetical protein